MRLLFRLAQYMAGALLLVLAEAASASDWKTYQARSYGFSMLVPAGVQVREREWGGGWGGLNADFEGVKLYGLAKLGPQATNAEIEAFAVRTIGIPVAEWRQVDAGTNQRGFARYKTFEAVRGGRLYFGGYGVGSRGNYLLYIETTTADYAAHRADYHQWYESIRLD